MHVDEETVALTSAYQVEASYWIEARAKNRFPVLPKPRRFKERNPRPAHRLRLLLHRPL